MFKQTSLGKTKIKNKKKENPTATTKQKILIHNVVGTKIVTELTVSFVAE